MDNLIIGALGLAIFATIGSFYLAALALHHARLIRLQANITKVLAENQELISRKVKSLEDKLASPNVKVIDTSKMFL